MGIYPNTGRNIEIVDKFIYFGVLVTSINDESEEITRRITTGYKMLLCMHLEVKMYP